MSGRSEGRYENQREDCLATKHASPEFSTAKPEIVGARFGELLPKKRFHGLRIVSIR
ncbi:MAG TPA: hypothetical protein VKX28_29205 [Xanthobacteraceae bacterium]|nr:hypothetical protein [Xanthobacteraceae bacterium]